MTVDVHVCAPLRACARTQNKSRCAKRCTKNGRCSDDDDQDEYGVISMNQQGKVTPTGSTPAGRGLPPPQGHPHGPARRPQAGGEARRACPGSFPCLCPCPAPTLSISSSVLHFEYVFGGQAVSGPLVCVCMHDVCLYTLKIMVVVAL